VSRTDKDQKILLRKEQDRLEKGQAKRKTKYFKPKGLHLKGERVVIYLGNNRYTSYHVGYLFEKIKKISGGSDLIEKLGLFDQTPE